MAAQPEYQKLIKFLNAEGLDVDYRYAIEEGKIDFSAISKITALVVDLRITRPGEAGSIWTHTHMFEDTNSLGGEAIAYVLGDRAPLLAIDVDQDILTVTVSRITTAEQTADRVATGLNQGHPVLGHAPGREEVVTKHLKLSDLDATVFDTKEE